ncbi:hypothetical protein LPC08_06205 [Roseomonas sp. OT10]|uniref:hypothetical protein n=1 Tax=Roseomonas cutis TaxID=2897332 RepID=UPI001E5688BB|nr:hypothetical protein [Roseomonas sp. OT10]UFN50215.1 hypothetical protein LPC08_06205 [Roseomonas sp. OT10]
MTTAALAVWLMVAPTLAPGQALQDHAGPGAAKTPMGGPPSLPSPPQVTPPQATPPGAAPSQAASGAEGPRLQSSVETLRLVPLRSLPRAPVQADASPRRLCQHLLTAPQSPEARQVEAQGWGVSGEVLVGPYRAVGFVGAYEVGTSGSCRLGDGNLALFRDGRLAALAYSPAGSRRTIGSVEPLERDGARLWDGDYLRQPLADLRLRPDGTLALLPLAEAERVCGGAATVPNIYGRPIRAARRMLQAQGWTPVPGPPATRRQDGRVAAIVRGGVPEVEDCSGTGFGFCSFAYRGTAGTLSVTTAGDGNDPGVAGYGTTCRAGG